MVMPEYLVVAFQEGTSARKTSTLGQRRKMKKSDPIYKLPSSNTFKIIFCFFAWPLGYSAFDLL